MNTDVGVRQQSQTPDLPGLPGVRMCGFYSWQDNRERVM